ncbi:hypothetical protein [Streptomyces candidus]|uniref:Uncharacterized protein n=1 Tax=Streptomyces candidus TaxID=67283 RepID=A0A7X0LS87_9ACTN|nr:hypothetical protein [Streptomyces candidus]MBB6438194.1 hypothetical protein [Streptomyces candidus]
MSPAHSATLAARTPLAELPPAALVLLALFFAVAVLSAAARYLRPASKASGD